MQKVTPIAELASTGLLELDIILGVHGKDMTSTVLEYAQSHTDTHTHILFPSKVLKMVTYNIGALAWLHAKGHGCQRIIFSGSFLNDNMMAKRTLSYHIDYVSKGTSQAIYLEHDGYVNEERRMRRKLPFLVVLCVV